MRSARIVCISVSGLVAASGTSLLSGAAAPAPGWVAVAQPSQSGFGVTQVLPTGRVLRVEAGGRAAIYDPAAGSGGSWTEVSRPESLGAAGQALLLAGTPRECGRVCGSVLVRLGPPGVAWRLYDPSHVAAGWTAAADPSFQRGIGATFTRLDGPGCGSNCGKVLAVGGFADLGPRGALENSLSPFNAELYDPRTNAWEPTGSLAIGRIYHAAALLRGPRCGNSCGRVLVVGGGWRCVNAGHGGDPCIGAESTAALYDARAGTWAPAPAPGFDHDSGHRAFPLADGRILVAGRGTPASVQSEVFDPAANQGGGGWSPTLGSCECPADSGEVPPVGARLPDGEVLIVSPRSGYAELYDPRSNRWSPTTPSRPGVDSLTVLKEPGCGMSCGRVLALGPGGAQLYTPSGVASEAPQGVPTAMPSVGTRLSDGYRLGGAAALVAGIAAIGAWAVRRRRRRARIRPR